MITTTNISTIVDGGNHPQQISTTMTADVDSRNTKIDRLQHQQLEQSIYSNNNNEIYDINNSQHIQNTAITTNSSAGETQTIRINDVLCGRGKVDHAGNAYFRQVVAEQLNDFKLYQSQKNRHGMSMVVQRIVQKVHDTGGRFIDQNWRGMWVELSEKERRQKVDRACRDAKKNSVSSSNRTTSSSAADRTTATSSVSATRNLVGRPADQTTTGIQYHTIHSSSNNAPQPQQQVLNHPITEVVRSESSPLTTTAASSVAATSTNSTTTHINQNSSAVDAVLPPSTMARLYPLTSGIHSSSYNSSKNKRNSTGQLIQVPTTMSANTAIDANHHPSAAPQAWAVASPATLSSSSVAADVPSSSLVQSPTTAATLGPSSAFNDVGVQQEKQQRMPSDFHHIGNPTYNNEPNASSTGNNSNIMESSISSFDKITDTTARTLSSSYITAPSLEFSCGSLAFENSFVIPESHQNNTNNHGNEPTIPSLIRQQQQPSQYRTSMDALQKRTTATGSNNNQHAINNASSTWTMASISSIPNDFLNKSVMSEMDFSAVSLDLFTPVEEEGTERSTDTEENEAGVCTSSTTSTATTATSTNTNPLTELRGGSSSTSHHPMNESLNNASAIMMDASVSVLDLNQSYQPGSFFDASYNDNSLLLESSVTATSFTNSTERKEAFRRSVSSGGHAPQQERLLDRYDLLKREESVDTIIAGNLRRHSQISKAGGQKSTDSNDDELAESFNMSLDICALPSTNEEDDEEETPKQERVVKNVFVTQQPLLQQQQEQSPYLRSPEKKKIKDATQLSLTSQLANNNSLWLSSDEFTSNRGNDSESVTSSLFSA